MKDLTTKDLEKDKEARQQLANALFQIEQIKEAIAIGVEYLGLKETASHNEVGR